MDDFETLISKCMKYRALKIFHDNDHLINSVIKPSGQLQAQGTDSFYRYMAKTTNDCIFWFFCSKIFAVFSNFFSNFDSMRAVISQKSCDPVILGLVSHNAVF